MFAAWEAIEDLSGLTLYTRTGGLDLAHRDTPGGRDIEEYRAALDTHGIPYEDLTIAEILTRYPQWTLQEGRDRLSTQLPSQAPARRGRAGPEGPDVRL
jgi:hypothetical protein